MANSLIVVLWPESNRHGDEHRGILSPKKALEGIE